MTLAIDFKQLKYLFIDFDGTLVDTVPLLFKNYKHFLEKYGHAASLAEFQSLMGPSIEEFIGILKIQYQLDESPQELIEIYISGLAERYHQEAQIMQGAQEFLDYAKKRALKFALVTSSSYTIIERTLEKLKLKAYFEHIVTSENVQKTKPDPEIYVHTLKICSAQPHQVVAIEDSYNGILASVRAHIPTIGIKNDHLISDLPPQTMLVNDWNELLQNFRQNYEK